MSEIDLRFHQPSNLPNVANLSMLVWRLAIDFGAKSIAPLLALDKMESVAPMGPHTPVTGTCPACRGFFYARTVKMTGMRNDLSREALAAFVREAKEQAEYFRKEIAAANVMLLNLKSLLMEQRCIKEHRDAMALIDARTQSTRPTAQE